MRIRRCGCAVLPASGSRRAPAIRVRDAQVVKFVAGHVADLCNGSTCSVGSRLHSRRSSVARDQSVRNRIVEYLAEHGAVEDSSGKATSVLKKAIAYEGTDAGFTQVVAAMAKAGLLTRQIRGKRTYRISQQRQRRRPQPRSRAMTSASEGPLGLRRVGRSAARPGRRVLAAAPTDTSESASWARRRLEQLEARNASLQRDVARANAEAEAVAAERDILQNQLEAAAAQPVSSHRPTPRAPSSAARPGRRASRSRRADIARSVPPPPSAEGHDDRTGDLSTPSEG